MSDALEPKLNANDRRVLALLPSERDEPMTVERIRAEREEALTVWQVGEALDTLDLSFLRVQLRGLQHLGYVHESKHGKHDVYWRTPKGDEAIT
jgi:predicted MarR family transcription regulator